MLLCFERGWILCLEHPRARLDQLLPQQPPPFQLRFDGRGAYSFSVPLTRHSGQPASRRRCQAYHRMLPNRNAGVALHDRDEGQDKAFPTSGGHSSSTSDPLLPATEPEVALQDSHADTPNASEDVATLPLPSWLAHLRSAIRLILLGQPPLVWLALAFHKHGTYWRTTSASLLTGFRASGAPVCSCLESN